MSPRDDDYRDYAWQAKNDELRLPFEDEPPSPLKRAIAWAAVIAFWLVILAGSAMVLGLV